MGCTCRNPARCPICNTPVRVPLTNLESNAGAAILVDKFARRDTSSSREGLRGLIQGSASCPSCGHTITFEHSRQCFSGALSTAGVPGAEREAILSKIEFPEG
ncbi:MAG: hypothetical protein ABR888_01435 [Thermoplasmata archaeon]|jgi:hypothetical protein|nr:hypothetical protein [Thermoplasmata archaeon]